MAKLSKIEEQTPAPVRKIVSLMFFSFLVTFSVARLFVYSATRGIIPNIFLYVRGVHVHHFTYGVFIIGLLCFYLLLFRPRPDTRAFRYSTLIYGIGLALTFDEFGMWIRLQDGYWVRQSYDAVIIISLILLNIMYWRSIRNFLFKETSHTVRFFRWAFRKIKKTPEQDAPKSGGKNIKAIIFDFDGVIHDTFDIAYGVNYKLHGMTEEEYKQMFEGNIYQHKVITEEKAEEFFKLQNEEYRFLKIEEGIRAELEILKRDHDLYIVSSNMELTLNMYFENNNIKHIFKEVLGMESHRSKVEKFKMLMSKYGLNKDNCIFVTDTLGDILEANKLELRTVAVDYGFHERERLQKGNPFKIISDFKEIQKIVNAL